jgi:F-type H+-transporting ATPase subunit beta
MTALSFYETGIKVIDLFAPLARGGIITLHSPGTGMGKFVLLCELAYRHAKLRAGRVVLVDSGTDATAAALLGEVHEMGVTPHLSMLYSAPGDPFELREQAALAGMVLAEEFQAQGDEVLLFIERPLITPTNAPALAARLAAAHEGITLLSDSQEAVWEPLPPALGPGAAHLAFSHALAQQHIWPAIDPLASQSSLLAEGIASGAHQATAQAARALLGQLGAERLGDDPEHLARAQRLQRLQAQPFFVAEPFTAKPGVFVPLADTLRSFQEVLDERLTAPAQ